MLIGVLEVVELHEMAVLPAVLDPLLVHAVHAFFAVLAVGLEPFLLVLEHQCEVFFHLNHVLAVVGLAALAAGSIEHLLLRLSIGIAIVVSFRLLVGLLFFGKLLLLTNHLTILLSERLLVALLLLNPHAGLLGAEAEYGKSLRGENTGRVFLGGDLIVELTYGGAAVVGEGVLRRVKAEDVLPFARSGEVVVGTVLGIGVIAVCVVVGIGIVVVAVGLVCIIVIIIVVLIKLTLFRRGHHGRFLDDLLA
mmetsp:Transcript_14817/g.26917  ORF Transcript_14817/g.26917 Transcript_14817/m.26917 type:complete len:250 (+) Transcript_14817:865-1614(+)